MPQHGGRGSGSIVIQLRSSLSRSCTNGLANSRTVASSRYRHRTRSRILTVGCGLGESRGMHERFTTFMNGISASLGIRRSIAATSPELRGTSVIVHLMGVALAIVVMLALMEPEHATGLNLFSSFVFFSLHLFPATVAAWFLSGWLFNARVSRRVPPWVLLVIAGAITGLLLAPISVTLELLFGVIDLSDANEKPVPMTLSDWPAELGYELQEVPFATAIAWPVMNALVIWPSDGSRVQDWRSAEVTSAHLEKTRSLPGNIDGSELTPAAAPSDPLCDPLLDQPQPELSQPLAEPSYFLDRLPRHLGRDIVYLEAQEHYLRVVTSRAEHLLLQGLTHAIAELESSGFEGIQIHRSVWVSWKHVEHVDARMNSLSVKLSNGSTVKLGRRRAKDVLAAWRKRQKAGDSDSSA
jgi:hypothetical protein